MPRCRGVSLVELLVCLALLAILLSTAAPSFSDLLARQRTETAAHSLRSALNLARETAVMTGQVVSIAAIDGDWSAGWRVFHDRNNDGMRQDDEHPLANQAAIEGVSIQADRTSKSYIHFRADGVSIQPNGAFHAGHLAVCGKGSKAYKLLINRSGRIRQESAEPATLCPR
ncbi:GspH/FimT family pseudopilin [Pseudomonas sp. QL9]|uniref:GspH/FimT family pseudopilin n=1 Tax=Pseudomonas sp. QL9 TaxID=3242725 RepID=UPI00352AE8B2